ncbi:hypothetical protein AZ54_12175 [Xanthomonas oryzae pv. oryzae PXO86]|nr:hypothetical protein AZ54_12175 [Xanthomonas oryzae pv. oryzae PXO86]
MGRRMRLAHGTENLAAQGFKRRACKQLIAMETFGAMLASGSAQVFQHR